MRAKQRLLLMTKPVDKPKNHLKVQLMVKLISLLKAKLKTLPQLRRQDKLKVAKLQAMRDLALVKPNLAMSQRTILLLLMRLPEVTNKMNKPLMIKVKMKEVLLKMDLAIHKKMRLLEIRVKPKILKANLN